jgi:hypothetical protein
MILAGLIISILLNVVFLYACLNAAKKVAIYDEFCEAVAIKVSDVLERMRMIDIRGSFEADDEVGVVFQALLKLVGSLQAYLPDEDNAKEKNR